MSRARLTSAQPIITGRRGTPYNSAYRNQRKRPKRNAQAFFTYRRIRRLFRVIGHPGGFVAVVFEARRGLQSVLRGVHRQISLAVLRCRLDSAERHRDILLASTEETAMDCC